MKKSIFRLSFLLATVLVLFASCSKEEYDEDLLIGSWNSTDNWSYIFYENHTGSRTQSFVTQNFTWSLDGDELELQFEEYEEGQSEMELFRVYIVQELNEIRMEVYDQADKSKAKIVFTKKK